MSASLSLKHSLKTSDKVVNLCFHPVQPWLAYVDKNSAVHVLNWESQEVVFYAQFGGLDEAALHYHALQKMAEQDIAFWGEKTSQELEISKTVSGKVHMVQFFDVETLFWQHVSQMSTMKGKAEDYPEGNVAGGDVLMGQRWLIVVCDNKLVLHEMLSHTSREISKVALEGKSPTTVATLTGPHGSSLRFEPILAVGCSDGAIRIVSFSTLKVIGRLGQKGSSITCLLALHLTNTATRLVSGASDGTLSVWDPFPSGGGSLQTNFVPPSVTIKAHEGDIADMELFPCPGEGSLPRICTIGGDRTVAAWEVGAFKEVLRFKQPSTMRIPYHTICYCPALITSPESFPMLLASNASKIWGATVSTGAVKTISDTMILLGNSSKAVKISAMAVHPLQTHLVAIGVGSGLAILTATLIVHPSMELLPGEGDKSSSGHEMTVLMAYKGSLCQREYMAVQKDGSGGPPAARSPELVQHLDVLPSSSLVLSGHCNVVAHASGLKIALLWPSATKYKIFRRVGPTDWEQCHEGTGKQVVWHTSVSLMAVLDVPEVMQLPSQKSSSERRSRGRSKADLAAIDAAAAAAAVVDPTIKIFRIPAAGPVHEEGLINFSGSPCLLFAGPVLGVAATPSPGDYSNQAEQLQFYDWETRQCCSSEMPVPHWIKWSPDRDVCALAYTSHMLICETIGDFVPVVSVPISDGTSGAWENRQLYVTTPSTVECVVAPRMASTRNGKPELMIQVVTLASFAAGPKWLTGTVDDSDTLPQPRPLGQLSVLGARGDNLWLVDSLGHPALINLGVPGFSSLRHASDNNFASARSASLGKVPADTLASLLVGMGTKSSIEALRLPALTLEVRLKVAIEAGYLKHALVCLEALALGCDRPEVVIRLPEFRDTLKDHNAKDDILESNMPLFNTMDLLGGPFATSSQDAVVNDDGTGGIDWETPLKKSTRPKNLKQDRERHLSESVAVLGIKLIDAATEARRSNTAMKATKLLMRHLPPETGSDLLLQVQTRLAERNKKKELEENTELSEKAKMTTSGRFTGLAAAALSGNSLLMTSVLKDLKMMAS